MKSGTAQASSKYDFHLCNDTAREVKGNKMVDMQLSNNKLVDRGKKWLWIL